MKYIVFILTLFYGSCLLTGQTKSSGTRTDQDCLTIMKEADKEFQDGLYEKCINNLEGALKSCILSRNEKEHTMELLAKAYIETDDIGKAESMVNLLIINFPHYELKEEDNSETFNRLVKKFKVLPLLSIGIRNTMHWFRFKPTETFSVLDGLDYSEPYSNVGDGFFYYGWGGIEFKKNISFNGDLIFMHSRYDRTIQKAPHFNLHFWEMNNFMEMPVYLKKYFPVRENVLSYVAAGVNWLYMTQANGNATIYYTKDDIITGKNTDFSAGAYNIDMMGMRNKNTFGWITGAGIGYKLNNLRLFLDARYYGGLNSLTNAGKRLSNTMLVNDYFYVDNSMRLNQFEIGASVSYTLINTVKRNRHW